MDRAEAVAYLSTELDVEKDEVNRRLQAVLRDRENSSDCSVGSFSPEQYVGDECDEEVGSNALLLVVGKLCFKVWADLCSVWNLVDQAMVKKRTLKIRKVVKAASPVKAPPFRGTGRNFIGAGNNHNHPLPTGGSVREPGWHDPKF